MSNSLKEDLVEAGTFGRSPQRRVERFEDLVPGRGVHRSEGSEANKRLRDFAVGRMKDAGLEVSFDRFGNIFGRKQGTRPRQKAVMCGSHLDSVTNGGQFDGALGVFAGIDAVRRLREEGFRNERPIEVVAFTGEEGSAFDIVLLGSAALTGKISEEKALASEDPQGRSLEQVLSKNGYLGEIVRDLTDVECFLEMHVEQGPVLFSEEIPLGIVEAITGIVWLNATIRGTENHAGTTPMGMRKDALVAGAEAVGFVRERASRMAAASKSSTVGTVGRFDVFPNGMNIVPGRVELGIDLRDVSPENLEELRDETSLFLKELEQKYGVRVEVGVAAFHRPVSLSRDVIGAIEASAQGVGVPYRKMNSGAGHDAQNMAARVKTGMIFVPSVGGISHSPVEWTHWEHIEYGAQVLTRTIKSLSAA